MSVNISGEVVRKLRVARNWTQEHLAHVIDRNVRTVQRVETSGVCDLETRAALAAAFGIEPAQLNGEKKIEQAASNAEDGVLYYQRVTTGQGVVDIFADSHWYRFSHEDPRTGDDAEYIAEIVQRIHDHSEIWGDIEPGGRVKATFEFGEMLKEMADRGFWLFGLRTRAKTTVPTRDGEGKPLTMKVCNFHVAYADSKKIVVLEKNT